jgi:hypothetical protein
VIGIQHYYAAKAVLSLHKLKNAMDHIDPSIDLLKVLMPSFLIERNG